MLVLPEEMDSEDRHVTPLYGLGPVGMGRSDCESLRGYLVRLAAEHRVRPRDIVARVLAHLAPEIGGWGYARFFSRHAVTVDGPGRYARTFAAALNRATGRNDLSRLTLLPWESLLSANGQPLLHPRPRWCSECLAELASGSSGAHWQLRWSIALTHSCSRHGGALRERCPSCGKAQPAIPRFPDLLHCDHCGGSLAAGPQVDGQAVRPASREARFVDEFLAALDRVLEDPRIAWCRFLESAVADVGDGQRARLCRKLGLQERALNGWLKKGQRVALRSVFDVCDGLQRSPAVVWGTSEPRLQVVESARASRRSGVRARHHPERRHAIRVTLESALCMEPLPTLRAIAAEGRVSRGYLTYWFPDLTRQLADRRRQQQADRKLVRQRERVEMIVQVVEAAKEVGVHPGRKLVEAAARRAGFSLMNEGMLESYRIAVMQEFNESGPAHDD